MASLIQGFPPSNTISPSVRIVEIDNSYITADQSFHQAGLVGFASKGPINIPTLVQTSRQLHTVFGLPHPDSGDPYMLYAADQYLSAANTLYVVRVAATDPTDNDAAQTASVDVPASGSIVELVGSVAGPFTFGQEMFFRFSVNGVSSSKTLVVMPGTYTATQLAAALNQDLSPSIDGLMFGTDNTGAHLTVATTFSFGPAASLELVSVQDSLYGPSSPVGLGTGMTVASTTSTTGQYPNDSYGTPGHYNFSGLTDLNLQIVLDGTDNVTIDNRVQVVDLSSLEGTTATTAQIVSLINSQAADLPGGFHASATGNNITISTLHSGNEAALLVKTASAGSILGFNGLTANGSSPSGLTGDNNQNTFGVVSGTASTSVTCFTVSADSPGIDGNLTSVTVSNDSRSGVFQIDVYNNGTHVESWGSLTKDQESSYYVETYLSLVSSYLTVSDNTATLASPRDGTYVLSGGSDGIPADPDDQDDLLVGNVLGYSGLQALSDTEQYDIDLIAVPGHTSTAVVSSLINMAEARGDCMAIVDPPFGLTVEEIVQWQNGIHPLNMDRFDSDFAALYWPWVMTYDSFNAINVWVPPSGSVMATYARSDGQSAPWFAPAGLSRGQVPNILDVFSRPSQDDRDLMYGNANAINPIITFPDIGGFVLWGQKTLQRTPSALDRVNVRRMMFVIEKRIKAATRTLLFDPNDATFQSRFETIVTTILKSVQVGRGITSYTLDDGADVNTADVIQRNEYRANIGIVPTYAVEFIFLTFTVNSASSASNSF